MIILPSSAGIYRPFAGSTAWTPSSLPLLAWYKADAGVLDASDNPVTADSTAVKTWQDQSGNGRHLVQNTSASRPVFRTVANSFSSLPALEASGSQFLENTALSLGSDVSVYVVCKLVGTPTDFTGVFQLGSNHAHLLFNDNTQHFRIQGVPTGSISDVVSGAAATNTRQVLKMDLATTVFRFKQSADGINSATNPTTITLGTGYKLFQNYIGTATCQISEFILCSRVLTSGEEASLNTYLKTRYAVDTNAIYYTLPVNGAALWLDGSRLDSLYTTDTGSTNVPTNAGAIGRWEDLSGNARHATQATAGSRPTWLSPANGLNGLGAADFNSGRFFYASIPSLANGYTLYVVLKYPSVGSGYYYVISRNAAVGGGAFGMFVRTSYMGLTQSSSEFGSGSTSINTTYGFIGKYDGSHTIGNFRLRVSNASSDLTSTMPQNASTPPAGTGQIGRADNNGAAFNGTIMELVLFDSQRSTDDDTAMKNYLAAKWGISWS